VAQSRWTFDEVLADDELRHQLITAVAGHLGEDG
jgi:hypothetical protein